MAQRLPHDPCSDSFHLQSQRCSDFYLVLPRGAFCLQPNPPNPTKQTTEPTKPNQPPNHNDTATVPVCCFVSTTRLQNAVGTQVFVSRSRYFTSHKLSYTQHTTKTCGYKLINHESTKSAVESAEATKYCAQQYI